MSGFVRKMSTVTAAKRLIPLLDRVLVEKIVPPTRSAGGILLPETTAKELLLKSVLVSKNKEGNIVPLDVKKGDTVLLPEYGGSHVKLEGGEYVLYRHDDLLGILEQLRICNYLKFNRPVEALAVHRSLEMGFSRACHKAVDRDACFLA